MAMARNLRHRHRRHPPLAPHRLPGRVPAARDRARHDRHRAELGPDRSPRSCRTAASRRSSRPTRSPSAFRRRATRSWSTCRRRSPAWASSASGTMPARDCRGPWVHRRRGQRTDDPDVLFAEPKGALLPLGGLDAGYKGFGARADDRGADGRTRRLRPRRSRRRAGARRCSSRRSIPAAFGGVADFRGRWTGMVEASHASRAAPGRRARARARRGRHAAPRASSGRTGSRSTRRSCRRCCRGARSSAWRHRPWSADRACAPGPLHRAAAAMVLSGAELTHIMAAARRVRDPVRPAHSRRPPAP